MKQKRNRNHNTPLAFHMRRLGLHTLEQIQRVTRAPYGDLKNWKQGRCRTPRHILRLLAAYRLLNWGKTPANKLKRVFPVMLDPDQRTIPAFVYLPKQLAASVGDFVDLSNWPAVCTITAVDNVAPGDAPQWARGEVVKVTIRQVRKRRRDS